MNRKSRKMHFLKLIIPRKKGLAVRIVLLTLTLAALTAGWWLADLTSKALLPPHPAVALDHFRLNRSLKSYLENIRILIEPSSTACSLKKVDVLVLVTSSPLRFWQRQTIRETWGKHLPTYFVVGLDGTSVKDMLVDNYVEAKMYSDMIIFEFQDHYQNLTLKTALMIQWTVDKCPPETMLFKTDDDVLVNPWKLKQLVEQYGDKDLIGYRKLDNYLHRDEYNKWYLPRWLYRQDFIPEYLSGTGYLINGRNLKDILEASFNIPVINLEDVYFTYIVAREKLGLNLTHDWRLSPYKPWWSQACIYRVLASAHSLAPGEMGRAWKTLETLGSERHTGHDRCGYYESSRSEIFLY